ncbi:MAG: TIM-barrel domain-containing protein, partial [Pseudomonadota bacterium]
RADAVHGIGPREPWSYGPEAEAAAMEALRLRYRLLPYIEKTIAQSCATGLPVQRMMAIACPDERESWSFDDQFFFGDDLLVAPCYDPSGAVEVYLPSGQWRRFLADNGALHEGGRVHRLTLSLTDMAVFVRDGVHIPLGDDMEYIN